MNPPVLSLFIWLLALVGIALSAAAQLLMKVGMNGLHKGQKLTSLSFESIFAVIGNAWVVGGLLCYGLSAAAWLVVLSRMPLSLAYPLIALGIATVVIFSALLLEETIGPVRITGVVLIVIGVALVGRG